MKYLQKGIVSLVFIAIAIGLFFFAQSNLLLWQKIVSNLLFGVYAAFFYLYYTSEDMRGYSFTPVTEWRRAPSGMYRVDGFVQHEKPTDFAYRKRNLWLAIAIVFLIVTVLNTILSIFVLGQGAMRVELMIHSALFVPFAILIFIFG